MSRPSIASRKKRSQKRLKNPEAVFLAKLAQCVEAGEVVGVLGLYMGGGYQAAAFCMGEFSVEQVRAAVVKMGADFEEMIAGREIGPEVLS